MFSFVESQNENEMTNDDAVENLRSRQCLLVLQKLNKLFWNKQWKFKTNDDGKPFLHRINYGDENADKSLRVADYRYLCIFSKERVEPSDQKPSDQKLNEKPVLHTDPLESAYLRRLFLSGWNLGKETILSELASGGSHNPHSTDIVRLLKHLNLKLDGTDIVIDIGYGTGTLLYALACMLQTRVYGSEISIEVFNNTKQFINSTKKIVNK